jgi:toxin ParE1/3/4
MAQVKIRSTRLALRDLEFALISVSQESRAAVAPVLARIEQTAAALSRHPPAGRDGRAAGTREFAVSGTPFIMAYRVTRDAVEILGLMHRARPWPDRL